MLRIRFIMNSAVEEIFSFKSCCGLLRAFDQNLEIQVTNTGHNTIEMPSHFDAQGDQDAQRVHTLLPHGAHRIEPGQIKGFYCFMDETVWRRMTQATFYDRDGNRYMVPIIH